MTKEKTLDTEKKAAPPKERRLIFKPERL